MFDISSDKFIIEHEWENITIVLKLIMEAYHISFQTS